MPIRQPRVVSENGSRRGRRCVVGFAALGIFSAATLLHLSPLPGATEINQEVVFVNPLPSGELDIFNCPSVRSCSRVARLAGRESTPGAAPGKGETATQEAPKVKLTRGEETIEQQYDRVAKFAKHLKNIKGKAVPYGGKPWDKPRFKQVIIYVLLESKQAANKKVMNQVIEELRAISGMHPRISQISRDSNIYGWRKGDNCGAVVNIRGSLMYDFLYRLNTIYLPRVRDFEGLIPSSFDNRGNFQMQIENQEPFKELDELIDQREVTHSFKFHITNNCLTQPDGLKLMQDYGFPFRDEPRPRRPKKANVYPGAAAKQDKKTQAKQAKKKR
eukprot:TRINITY_DN35429_c0_g1_i1.p1 TRINITY_DN35429_c0_g1~~TRINITY_DN35429_c0_g1_i1.p1  ORF type:complete len:331 (-),score=70.92 TRINITY_DN35429_c0_g1_i1:144-1136(-)